MTTLEDYERQILNGEIVISDENKDLLEMFKEASIDKVIHHNLMKLRVDKSDISKVIIPNIGGHNTHAFVQLKKASKNKFNNQDYIILSLSKSKSDLNSDLMEEVRKAAPENKEFIVLIANDDAAKFVKGKWK